MRIAIALLVLVLVAGSGPAQADRRVALVIGNGAYTKVGKLPNPTSDAKAMESLFRAAGFDEVLARQDLGRDAMRRALRELSDQVRDADIVVVFYAGHGIEVNGTNYLIPVDAVLERDLDVEDETVSLDRLMQIIEPVKRLRLVILDACRDNPFMRSMQRTISGRSIGRGLARVDVLTSDTLIAFAARAGSTAADGKGTNSPYTTALLKHLTTPGLDLRLALGRVRDDVLTGTANRQEPFLYGSLGGAEISLVPARTSPQSLQVSEAERTWAWVKNTTDQSLLENFIKQFADTPFGAEARARLEQVRKQQPASTTISKPSPEQVETPKIASTAEPLPAYMQRLSTPDLWYFPWVKVCQKADQQNPKQVCANIISATLRNSGKTVYVSFLEQEGQTDKALRVEVPTTVDIQAGARIVIDNGQPIPVPYGLCPPSGCVAQYTANSAFLSRLKKGQSLTVQVMEVAQQVDFRLPLSDFGKAYDGPPIDSKVYEVQKQKALQVVIEQIRQQESAKERP